ncbi:MAG: dTDP-4-dehydrorhamnose 3,5-epimerase [Candidatus Andersenbacteria bacterium]|nr:dTDP-4-dehydrorhamnose 3,5-epimerase [bacterium]MDZ4225587.1 dTDP-4-dehydrorhamnose 3,5-epimerase [Candidatus Andersenbacteria bacterium]
MSFEFKQLEISGVVSVRPKLYPDERGLFAEMYRKKEFSDNGIEMGFVQVNHSASKHGVLRGLHYQLEPKTQGKLITAITGEIFDVAVDLRKSSDSFGRWVGKKLEARTKELLYIPPGFAHGFVVLADKAEVIYYCTDYYSPDHERGVRWNDAKLNIEWPVENPVVSERDANFPDFDKGEYNFV